MWKTCKNLLLTFLLILITGICLFGKPILNELQEDILLAMWTPAPSGATVETKGTWSLDENGWQYTNSDGQLLKHQWVTIDSYEYYFNKKGYMKTGWIKQKGKKYYLNQAGQKMTGWIEYKKQKYYLDNDGIMLTGWQKIDGSKYHFEKNGSLSSGWVKSKNKYYYMDENGTAHTGWLVDNGKYYYLNKKGVMKTGWLQEGDTWYYLADDGAMVTGWQAIKNKTYYFDSTGAMQIGWHQENKTWYYFSTDGAMQTGWIHLDDGNYYLNEDGSMKTGWLFDSSKAYYLDSDGRYNKNYRTVSQGSMVALTYDNGPGTQTSSILDTLEANDAHATFFVLGSNLTGADSILNRMKNIGCQIGNHSYDNTAFSSLSNKQIKKEISATNKLIKKATGHGTSIARTPEGSCDENTAKIMKRAVIGCTLDSKDQENNRDATVERILENVNPGDVILLHDSVSSSGKTAALLIPALKEMGYELVTVEEMAKANGVSLKKGHVYNSLS